MIKWLLNKRAWVLVLLAGAMPLGTVADCGYAPGVGGTLYYDRYDRGRDYHDGGVVIIEDYGYDDVYYEEIYYEDGYYEDDFCDPFSFWDCWW